MGFARPYRVALWASIILALGAQVFELAVPWLTGDVIDEAIRPRDTDAPEDADPADARPPRCCGSS